MLDFAGDEVKVRVMFENSTHVGLVLISSWLGFVIVGFQNSRISLKLFDKHPGQFPVGLRSQVSLMFDCGTTIITS